jgi:hypothetical protein
MVCAAGIVQLPTAAIGVEHAVREAFVSALGTTRRRSASSRPR